MQHRGPWSGQWWCAASLLLGALARRDQPTIARIAPAQRTRNSLRRSAWQVSTPFSAAHRRVLDSGHPVFGPPQQRPWDLWDFRIVDPDDYYLRVPSRARIASRPYVSG